MGACIQQVRNRVYFLAVIQNYGIVVLAVIYYQ